MSQWLCDVVKTNYVTSQYVADVFIEINQSCDQQPEYLTYVS